VLTGELIMLTAIPPEEEDALFRWKSPDKVRVTARYRDTSWIVIRLVQLLGSNPSRVRL
jgi:hypothetical protein